MGTCSECSKDIGECDLCDEDFQNKMDIICYETEKHFCNEDCLLAWLKNNGNLKETVFEQE